ncbi:MAG TPA: hypothetical protein VGB36_08065 [Gammaproteobacteria bacterium]
MAMFVTPQHDVGGFPRMATAVLGSGEVVTGGISPGLIESSPPLLDFDFVPFVAALPVDPSPESAEPGAAGVVPGTGCFAAVEIFRILQQGFFPSSDTCLVSKLAYTGEPTRSLLRSAGSATWN